MEALQTVRSSKENNCKLRELARTFFNRTLQFAAASVFQSRKFHFNEAQSCDYNFSVNGTF